MCTVRKTTGYRFEEKNNISSNSKNSKSKNVSVIIGNSIIKDIKSCEPSNESEKFVVTFLGGATAKDMESHIQPTIERAPSNIILHCGTNDLKLSTDSSINCRKHHQPCKIHENR